MSKNEVVENEVAVEKTEKVSNIVRLENGEMMDFGKSGKSVASYDVETKTLTFKVVTGEVLTRTLSDEETANLTPLQIEKLLYAEQEKIKSTLAPIKAVLSEEEVSLGKLNVADKIRHEFKQLEEGLFNTRSADTNVVSLDSFMKAFAYFCATGKVPVNGTDVPVPEAMWPFKAINPEWKDVEDIKVINEIHTFWNSLDRTIKSQQRRNPYLKLYEMELEAAK